MEPFNIDPCRDADGVRTEALVSIAVSLKRIADMMASEPINFADALGIASARYRQNPNWRKLEHTPWENDAPVIAATLMCEVARRLRNHYAAHIISEAEAGPLNPKPGDAE